MKGSLSDVLNMEIQTETCAHMLLLEDSSLTKQIIKPLTLLVYWFYTGVMKLWTFIQGTRKL